MTLLIDSNAGAELKAEILSVHSVEKKALPLQ